MAVANYEFAGLGTRKGFNRSLRHFKSMTEIVGSFEEYRNLADILNELLDEKELEASQLNPILNALLVGHPKYNYINRSYNLENTISEFSSIVKEVGTWTSVDMVLSYFHPDLGLTLINPKNEQHWDSVQTLRKSELLTVYSGTFTDKENDRLCQEASEKLIGLLEGKKVKISASFTKGKFKQRPSAPKAVPAKARPARKPKRRISIERAYTGAAAPSAASAADQAAPLAVPAAPPQKRRMTPMYSIPVTNELFHNGNVEAWKKVIQSYTIKYSGLDVFIFYEGERIHDINTLFKWGKVKHGSAILIAVAGENVQDVAKLRRYLSQGASPMFEAFLKFPVNTILNLF